jgi:hypothetical protein
MRKYKSPVSRVPLEELHKKRGVDLQGSNSTFLLELEQSWKTWSGAVPNSPLEQREYLIVLSWDTSSRFVSKRNSIKVYICLYFMPYKYILQ